MDNDLYDIIDNFHEIRRSIREMKHIEKYLRDEILRTMDYYRVDEFDTERFTVKRRRQSSTMIRREDVPEEVWNRYARRGDEYVIVDISPR